MTSREEASVVLREFPAVVFVNPSAGNGRAHAYLPRLRQLFESFEISAQFVETSSAIELESAARQSASQGQQLLLALGGDGTFQALVNGSFGANVTVGVLPAGAGNDFAGALSLPCDPLKATEVILKGIPRIDLVRVRTADGCTRMYVGGGGIGLDAEAARHAATYRHLPGRLRYLAAALQALSSYQALNVRIEFPAEDLRPLETNSLLAAVLNTPTYGAGLRLAPDALIDDGMLNLVLIENMSNLRVSRLLPRLISAGELRTSRVKRWNVRRVKISTDRLSFFHGDGEILGPAPVEIEIVPQAVQVMAPETASGI